MEHIQVTDRVGAAPLRTFDSAEARLIPWHRTTSNIILRLAALLLVLCSSLVARPHIDASLWRERYHVKYVDCMQMHVMFYLFSCLDLLSLFVLLQCLHFMCCFVSGACRAATGLVQLVGFHRAMARILGHPPLDLYSTSPSGKKSSAIERGSHPEIHDKCTYLVDII